MSKVDKINDSLISIYSDLNISGDLYQNGQEINHTDVLLNIVKILEAITKKDKAS